VIVVVTAELGLAAEAACMPAQKPAAFCHVV
jgi:hypothetical protein